MRILSPYLRYVSVLFIVGVSIALAPGVLADGTGPNPPGGPQIIKLENPLGSTSSLSQLLSNIINWLAKTFGPIAATLMIIVGALFILFAGDNEERFKTGKKIILYTAIGYGIIIVGWGIKGIIEGLLK